MTAPDRIDPEYLVCSNKVIFKYKRLTISSNLLPLWARLLPENEVKLETSIENVDKASKLLALLEKWFENLELKEINYAKDDTQLDRKTN